MGDLGHMVAEGANIDFFAEACLLGLCFEGLDVMANALVGSARPPMQTFLDAMPMTKEKMIAA
jgi:hypothetical protein